MAALIFVSTSAGFVGGWLGAKNIQQNNDKASIQAGQKVVLSESQVISDIAKNVGPSVVSVSVTGTTLQSSGLFGFSEAIQRESAGTGLIISSDGVILTNRHVVPSGTSKVTVTLSDGTELTSVEVIGRTNDSDPLDVAYLKIKDKKGKTLRPAKLGDSSKTQVGDKVGSFVKRRLGLPSGSKFEYFDQLGFVVFALAFASIAEPAVGYSLGAVGYVTLLAISYFTHAFANWFAFKIKLKDVPW